MLCYVSIYSLVLLLQLQCLNFILLHRNQSFWFYVDHIKDDFLTDSNIDSDSDLLFETTSISDLLYLGPFSRHNDPSSCLITS